MGGYNFNNPTYIFRFDYVGFKGLNVGGSYTKNNVYNYVTLKTVAPKNKDKDSLIFKPAFALSITDLHASYNDYNITAKVQYASVSHDEKVLGFKSQDGFLFEAGYDLLSEEDALIPFYRYEIISNKAGFEKSGNSKEANDLVIDKATINYHTFGLNYKPLSQVVIKAEYQSKKSELKDADAITTLSFAVGYMF